MTEAPQPIRGMRAIHLHVSAVASWPPFRKGINYRQERKVLKSRKVLRTKNVIPFLQYAPAHPSSALSRTTAFQGNLHLPKMAKTFKCSIHIFRRKKNLGVKLSRKFSRYKNRYLILAD
jgi:hypothetical protein